MPVADFHHHDEVAFDPVAYPLPLDNEYASFVHAFANDGSTEI